MAKQSNKDAAQAPTGAGSVDALASRALSMVAKRNIRSASGFDVSLAERLRDAAVSESSSAVQDLMSEMLKNGILPEVIATQYIPHAARQMGDEWCDDTLSFARVTIGSSRLQSSLRVLGTEWASHGYNDEGTAGVVVVVAKDAYHTLGPIILSGQLRRMGHSVRLALDASPHDLSLMFRASEFDLALISASEIETLDSLRDCVDIIRQSASVCPPIVIGGSVLDQEVDILAATGADFATKDPFEALQHCGLTKTNSRTTTQPTLGT